MLRLPFEEAPDLFRLTTEAEREKYQLHFKLLLEWNERMALVSRKSIERSFQQHYADSIWTSNFARSYCDGRLVYDLGSGAGFPGIIFAIRYPELRVTLFERSKKKQLFLTE